MMEKTFVLESVIYLSLSPFIKKIKIVPPVVHGVKLSSAKTRQIRPFLAEQEIGNLYSLHFLPTIQVYDGYAKTILLKNGYPIRGNYFSFKNLQ